MMNFAKQVHRIEKIDELIRSRQTGSPVELAKLLNISVSHAHCTLKRMRKLGAPIKFSRENRCYYYTSNKKFVFGFVDIDHRPRSKTVTNR